MLESVDKLSAKDLTQHLAGKEEPLGCRNPVGEIERQAAGGNDAMDMGVNFEFLTPGVQHTEEADLCTEMLGIARDLEKGFRSGAQQEIVYDFLGFQDTRGNMTGKLE